MTAPTLLSVAGNYTNNGTFTAGSGKVYLSGTAQQTLSGALGAGGTSAFNDLEIRNTIGTGGGTQSIIFTAAASTTGTFSMIASTSAQFLASLTATSTFQNIDWNGLAETTRVWLRSSVADSVWGLKVPGTRTVSYVNARDSNACSDDANINATDGTNVNAGGNMCWDFTVPQPALEQLHYRWFNDNGVENTATPTNTTDTALSGVYVGDRKRLRLVIPNNGSAAATAISYRLEVASTTCDAWYPVPNSATTEHWSMTASGYVGNSASTTDSSFVANPGGKTFIPGYLMTSNNQTGAHTLSTTQFAELEYSIKSTANVSTGVLYCFRVTNAGSETNFTYTVRPEATVLPATYRPSGGGGGAGGGEGSGSGPAQGGGAPPGGGDPEGGGDGPPQGGGGTGGGGGDIGYWGGTRNLAAVSAATVSGQVFVSALIEIMRFIFR